MKYFSSYSSSSTPHDVPQSGYRVVFVCLVLCGENMKICKNTKYKIIKNNESPNHEHRSRRNISVAAENRTSYNRVPLTALLVVRSILSLNLPAFLLNCIVSASLVYPAHD